MNIRSRTSIAALGAALALLSVAASQPPVNLAGGDNVIVRCSGAQLQVSRQTDTQVALNCTGAAPQPTRTPTQPPRPTATPTRMPSPTPVVTGGDVPYGPFHFGESPNDYSSPLQPVFNGSFLHLGKTTVANATTLLELARSHGMRVIVSIGDSYPCAYWNGKSFNRNLMVADTTVLVSTVARYYPNTVIGVMLLNEPHDPQPNCTPAVPPIELYNTAKDIRAAFAQNGAGGIPLGFGSPPGYFEAGLTPAQAADGTITLSFAQWHSGKGTIQQWAVPIQTAAARMGHKLAYSVNATQLTTTDALAANTWQCQQADALSVWWYSWSKAPAMADNVSLAQHQAVRAACDRP